MTQYRIRGTNNPRRSREIKPVFVMNQEGLSDLEKQAVQHGAYELIDLAEVSGVDIIDFGVFRNEGYKDPNNCLNQFQSVDWYVEKGRESSRNGEQLNAYILQGLLGIEPWRDVQKGGQDHYDIFILHEDIYYGDTNFVMGVAQPGIGTTISTHRFKDLNDRTKYECIKTETMHELGHVFGLVPSNRTQNVEKSLGLHCTNTCTMRQGLSVPNDWIDITNDRLKYGALCPSCEKDLKLYFKK